MPDFDQRQLDLFQRAAVELLGDFDLQPARLRGGDDGVGLAQVVGNRRLQQHVQPMLHGHQPDLAVGAVGDGDDADLRRGLPHQPVHVGEPGHAQAFAQSCAPNPRCVPKRRPIRPHAAALPGWGRTDNPSAAPCR